MYIYYVTAENTAQVAYLLALGFMTSQLFSFSLWNHFSSSTSALAPNQSFQYKKYFKIDCYWYETAYL